MGEYAEMIIEGLVDQFTGEVVDGHAPGYPRSKHRKKRSTGSVDGVKCQKCGKKFKSQLGADDHFRDTHTVEGQERRRKQSRGF